MNEEGKMTKKGIFVFIIISVCLLITPAPVLSGEYDMIAQEIEEAYINKKPRPLASQKFEDLTADQAHEIQTTLVKLKESKDLSGDIFSNLCCAGLGLYIYQTMHVCLLNQR
jgi:hypothetical protein